MKGNLLSHRQGRPFLTRNTWDKIREAQKKKKFPTHGFLDSQKESKTKIFARLLQHPTPKPRKTLSWKPARDPKHEKVKMRTNQTRFRKAKRQHNTDKTDCFAHVHAKPGNTAHSEEQMHGEIAVGECNDATKDTEGIAKPCLQMYVSFLRWVSIQLRVCLASLAVYPPNIRDRCGWTLYLPNSGHALVVDCKPNWDLCLCNDVLSCTINSSCTKIIIVDLRW